MVSVAQNISGSKNFIMRNVNRHVENCRLNSSTNAKSLLLTALVLDVYGNSVDAVKTLKNKEIPEEKRKYIAAYKMVNGIASFATEAVFGFTVADEKFQKALSEKMFGFLKKMDKQKFEKSFGFLKRSNTELFSNCSKGLQVASALVLATVFIKRLVVPFLVTPIASYLKKYMESRENKNKKEVMVKDFLTKKPQLA